MLAIPNIKRPFVFLKATVVISLFTLVSCSPQLNNEWKSEDFSSKFYSKVAVVGIGNDLKARKLFESIAVERLQAKGINAIEGITIFPADMSDEQKTPENLLKIIEENQVEAVIAMSLVSKEESFQIEGGNNEVVPGGYYRFGRFAVQRYQVEKQPVSVNSSMLYVIEAVLHDLKGDISEADKTLVWRGQSTLVQPESLRMAALVFTDDMVSHMTAKKVLLKKDK